MEGEKKERGKSGEGREGDWECGGCRNRNYAFRSFCNRCKQPRLLVDIKTPPDSKWLPRIGDWICTGCTNNNYASREKCKKCGQPKEVAAMPAIAIPGALPTYSHYFSRSQGGLDQRMALGSVGNVAATPSFPLGPNWSGGELERYGVHQSSPWPLGGNYGTAPPSSNQSSTVPKGWRNGDWICSCGFHNYASRAECKKCNASMPPALGMKRLASEEFVQDWDNKRLNSGHMESGFLGNERRSYLDLELRLGGDFDPKNGIFSLHPSASSSMIQNPILQAPLQFSNPAITPNLLGKGAKQWRSGDWMCTSCNNHNYASRVQCNRCKTPRDGGSLPISAV